MRWQESLRSQYCLPAARCLLARNAVSLHWLSQNWRCALCAHGGDLRGEVFGYLNRIEAPRLNLILICTCSSHDDMMFAWSLGWSMILWLCAAGRRCCFSARRPTIHSMRLWSRPASHTHDSWWSDCTVLVADLLACLSDCTVVQYSTVHV